MYRGANCGTFAKWGFKGMLKVKRRISFITVILFMICLLGCSKDSVISVSDASQEEIYSRKHISELADSVSFGYGRDDDSTMATEYMYSNSEIRELYGEDFEFGPEDVVCYNSEARTRFFLWNFKGVAEYSFRINDSKYIVKLKKDYNKKWEVTDCYLEEQDDINNGDDSLS